MSYKATDILKAFKWTSILIIIGYNALPIIEVLYDQVTIPMEQYQMLPKINDSIQVIQEKIDDWDELSYLSDLIGLNGKMKVATVGDGPTRVNFNVPNGSPGYAYTEILDVKEEDEKQEKLKLVTKPAQRPPVLVLSIVQ